MVAEEMWNHLETEGGVSVVPRDEMGFERTRRIDGCRGQV